MRCVTSMRWLLGLVVAWIGCAVGPKAEAAGAMRYRDLKIYTTSAAAADSSSQIVVQTRFRNEGAVWLKLQVRLGSSTTLGCSGGTFSVKLDPGKEAVWNWTFSPPAELERTVLAGGIEINGTVERDLYLSVQGTDPTTFADPGTERITERARVVATYAPRTHASILAQRKQQQDHAPRPALTLAAGGKSDYAIAVGPGLLPSSPTNQDLAAFWKEAKDMRPEQKDLVAALADLRGCIEKQSGAVLPVVAGSDRPLIRIRQTTLGRSAEGLQDAYRLRTSGKNVLIEAESLDGLRNGIYGLLTDHLDCHWFQPRQLGEEMVVPADRRVQLPKLDEVRGSRWFSCGGASWGNSPRWDRQNRALVNRGRMGFGHSWYNYINANEYPYDKFPQYYARDREGRIRKVDPKDESWTSSNFCPSDSNVLEIVARKVNAFFAANPDAIVTSLDPNDYAPMCLCDRCLALDRQYGATKDDGTEVAGRLLYFSQQIHDRLEPRFKDKFLGILIYGYQMELPANIQAHPHHAAQICDFPPRYDHSRPWNDPTSARNRDFYRLVKGWGSMLTQFGYYDYYGHYYYFGPFGILHKMREDLPAFHELGGTFLVLEAQPNFASQGLNLYVAARLAWDVDADVDLVLEEFFQKYYGPAAEPMRNYWLTAERYFALERPGTKTELRVAARPSFWSDLEICLRAAEAAVAHLPPDQQRFGDRIRLHRDGFDYGRLLNQYYTQYGWLAARNGGRIDHAAAIQLLQANRARIEGLQKKYPADDPYWPPLVPGYFLVNVEEEIKSQQEAQKTTGL